MNKELRVINSLCKRVIGHVENARQYIQHSIDTEMVRAYWLTGFEIIKEEQKGKKRAQYGAYLLKELSERLTKQYGKGFSIPTLKNARQFYLTYLNQPPIGYAVRSQLKSYAVRSQLKNLNPQLGWIHYRALMRVDRSEVRSFYEIEAIKNNWSGRELERQIQSLLFERLAKSKDKKGIMKLAIRGQEINKPSDIIKDPIILEFLDIPEAHQLSESSLEQALLDNLQKFLLELGNGFAFIARQKRLTLDGDHYYADLVFYHAKLKCYVLLDLKTRKLTHADIGQMLLYVNYFDREVRDQNDNPTIGLVLCTEKSDSMVKYMLSENNQQIFASKYKFYLPSEDELKRELQKELKQLTSIEKEE